MPMPLCPAEGDLFLVAKLSGGILQLLLPERGSKYLVWALRAGSRLQIGFAVRTTSMGTGSPGSDLPGDDGSSAAIGPDHIQQRR